MHDKKRLDVRERNIKGVRLVASARAIENKGGHGRQE